MWTVKNTQKQTDVYVKNWEEINSLLHAQSKKKKKKRVNKSLQLLIDSYVYDSHEVAVQVSMCARVVSHFSVVSRTVYSCILRTVALLTRANYIEVWP